MLDGLINVASSRTDLTPEQKTPGQIIHDRYRVGQLEFPNPRTTAAVVAQHQTLLQRKS